MVTMRMCHQDMTWMIASQIFVFRRRRGILREERIDQQMRAAGRHDLEGRVSEPGNRDRFLFVRRRRLRQRRSTGSESKRKSDAPQRRKTFHLNADHSSARVDVDLISTTGVPSKILSNVVHASCDATGLSVLQDRAGRERAKCR